MCDILCKSSSVAHVANQNYDEKMFEKGLATAMPAPNTIIVFNVDIKNVRKKVQKVVEVCIVN